MTDESRGPPDRGPNDAERTDTRQNGNERTDTRRDDDRLGVRPDGGGTDAGPTRVLAQGTFDLLHPGHVHYLREAAAMGDELHVIVARGGNVTHKESPILDERQRRDMVAALKPVDHALLGHPEDIFAPVEELDPDVLVLGYDQYHAEDAIQAALDERGIDCEVRRASGREKRYDREILSSGRIVERILEERG